jgi:hypothetical protein
LFKKSFSSESDLKDPQPSLAANEKTCRIKTTARQGEASISVSKTSFRARSANIAAESDILRHG